MPLKFEIERARTLPPRAIGPADSRLGATGQNFFEQLEFGMRKFQLLAPGNADRIFQEMRGADLRPIARRRHALDAPEAIAQMALAAEPDHERDVDEREIGIVQERLGALDPPLDLELMRRPAGCFLERGAEISRRQIDEIGDLRKGDVSVEVALEIIEDDLQL